MKEIVQVGHPVLRSIARDVSLDMFGKDELEHILKDMSAALAPEKFGVALAAPQIGIDLRIFIVSGRIFAGPDTAPADFHLYPDRVYINPVIAKTSKRHKDMHEGCLSVRGKWGYVPRATNLTLDYLDETGTKRSQKCTKLLAHIAQHEVDHLNGILYVDHAVELYDDTSED
jgi:peptide deformylase